MKNFILYIITFIVLTNCRKHPIAKESLSFGFYYEASVEKDCFDGFMVTRKSVYRDITRSAFKEPRFLMRPLPDSQFQVAKILLDSLPISELLKLPGRIGQPGELDGAAIYLGYTLNNKKHVWKIDMSESKIPSEIVGYVRLITSVKNRLEEE